MTFCLWNDFVQKLWYYRYISSLGTFVQCCWLVQLISQWSWISSRTMLSSRKLWTSGLSLGILVTSKLKKNRVVIPAYERVQFIYFYTLLCTRAVMWQQLLPKGDYSVIHGFICKMSALFGCANVSSSDSSNIFVYFLLSVLISWNQDFVPVWDFTRLSVL